jgi:hypothetical protein
MSTVPLTRRGAEMLKAELHRLKTVERHAVIQAISEARAQGDLSENAEYDAAKDKQGFIEGRIKDLEAKLAAANVIDPASVDAGHLPDRRRRRGRPQTQPDLDLQPHCARTHRQGSRRRG